MTSGKKRLINVTMDGMPEGTYYRVHPKTIKKNGVEVRCDPCDANPYSRARLAWIEPPDGWPSQIGMTYVSPQPAGALFEVVLRKARFLGNKRISCSRSALHGVCLSRLRLLRDASVVPITLPGRHLIIPPSDESAYAKELHEEWDLISRTGDYGPTHMAVRDVAQQCTVAYRQLAGFQWASKQEPKADVFLLYSPPANKSVWELQETIELDTAAGWNEIAQALWKINSYVLFDIQAEDGFDPPPGDD